MGGTLSFCFGDLSDGSSIEDQFIVVGASGSTIRSGESLKSELMCTLAPGTILKIDMIRGRRCHIVDPVRGWGTTSTERGYVIIEKLKVTEGTDKGPHKYKVVGVNGVVARNNPEGSIEAKHLSIGETFQSTGNKTIVNGVEWIEMNDGWIPVTKRRVEGGPPGEVLLQKIQ
mmetsp:Transcript_3206/g.4975  ORF Transcript_3206/g.4975 Transcript_3206/m.4975 type:complete len:172 (+) Transcript_3206:44-559(+)